ncbi:MAG: hypothetical protein ACYDH3_01360 [Candidatus Aminicenantales bacterium]
MKIAAFLAGILQALVALSALASGTAMIVYPSGSPIGMPLEMLKGSPFSDFFWPGVLLFAVIGLGHAAAAAMTFRRFRVRGLAGAVMGLGLMIWIFVQVNMIGGGHGLQYLFFALGTAEVSLAALILFLREPRR